MRENLDKFKKLFLIIAGALGLYALLGFFGVPYAIKAKVPEILQEMTGKVVTLDDVEFNPFSLTLNARGLAIRESDNTTIISLGELYVNYGLWTTIQHLAISIDEFRLTQPYTNLIIDENDEINLAHLFKTDEEDAEESDRSDEIVQMWVGDISIEQGQLDFTNFSNPSPYHASIQPINLSIEDLTTIEAMHSEDDSLVLDFDGGKVEWQGSVSLTPEIKSTGKIKVSNLQGIRIWEAIKDKVNFQVKDGKLGVETAYEFAMGNEGVAVLKLFNGQARLSNLAISPKDSEQQWIKIPELTVQGVLYDYVDQQLTIDKVNSNNAYALTVIDKNGQINLMTLYTGVVAKEVYQTAVELKPDEQPLLVNVKHIALKNYFIDATHETDSKPVKIAIKPINIDITGLSTQPGSQFQLAAFAGINTTGKIDAKGTIKLDPVEAQMAIKVDQVALKPFQPYLDQQTKLKLVRGTVSVDNQLDFALPKEGDMRLEVTGNARVDKLKTVAATDNKDFLKWRSVNLDKIKFTQSPLQLAIATITVNQLVSTFIINTDKTTNVSRIFSAPENTKKTTQKTTGKQEKSEPFALKINLIKIQDSSSFFADRGLILPFATDIDSLNGTIKNISSDKRARSSIDLHGKVDSTSPVLISGSFEPFDIENYLDINMQFKGISMTSFTPYMAQFAGYKVEKGKLTVELDYNIRKKKLQAENKVEINQLTLGEPVDSPDSVSLPVGLAIGLLKDVNGNINLDLPVTGSLDDPAFSIWGLVGDALLNLLTKTVSAPFSMIAGLVGSDADLSKVVFKPGHFELDEQQQQNLKTIVQGLQQRPQLQLEVRGMAYRKEDGQALSENAILMQIKTEKWNDLFKFQRPDRIEDVVLSDEDYQEFLTDIYKKRFPDRASIMLDKLDKTSDEAQAKQIYAQMLQQLVEAYPANNIELNRLADKRAGVILKFLTDQDSDLKKRIFLLNHKVEPSVENGEVVVELELGA